MVNGKARMRRPVAWNTALAMAAATPRIPISPIPLMPMAFNRQTLQLQQVKRRAWRLLIGDYGCGSDSFARRCVRDRAIPSELEDAGDCTTVLVEPVRRVGNDVRLGGHRLDAKSTIDTMVHSRYDFQFGFAFIPKLIGQPD